MKRLAACSLVALLASAGCGLLSAIDDPVYPEASSDSGSGDTSVAEVGEDAGAPEVAFDASGDTSAAETLSDASDSGDALVADSVGDALLDAGDGGSDADAASDVSSCTPGSTSCAGSALTRCSDAGVAETVDTCSTPELCAASGTGPCKVPTCAVGEKRCVGKMVETCNAGRTGFGSTATCDVGCDAGACLTILNVVGGDSHSCALLSNGTVRCWGSGNNGQLGNGSKDTKLSPTEVPGLKFVAEIASGSDHVCVRLVDGTVRCWGSNQYDQIGDGAVSIEPRLYPSAVPFVANVVEVSLGTNVSCVRLIDGNVRCWGQSSGSSTATPITGLGASNTQVAAGAYHACALKSDRSVWCWGGFNGSGELGDGTTTAPSGAVKAKIADVTQIAAGDHFSCGLLSDATVRCWGALFAAPNNYGGTPVAIAGLTGVTSIVARASAVCAKLSSGGYRCWGANSYGEVADGTQSERLTPIAPTVFGTVASGRTLARGDFHSMMFDGAAVYATGADWSGQLGNGKTADQFLTLEKVLW